MKEILVSCMSAGCSWAISSQIPDQLSPFQTYPVDQTLEQELKHHHIDTKVGRLGHDHFEVQAQVREVGLCCIGFIHATTYGASYKPFREAVPIS